MTVDVSNKGLILTAVISLVMGALCAASIVSLESKREQHLPRREGILTSLSLDRPGVVGELQLAPGERMRFYWAWEVDDIFRQLTVGDKLVVHLDGSWVVALSQNSVTRLSYPEYISRRKQCPRVVLVGFTSITFICLTIIVFRAIRTDRGAGQVGPESKSVSPPPAES